MGSFLFPRNINLKRQPITPKIKTKIKSWIGRFSEKPKTGKEDTSIKSMHTNLIHLFEGLIPFCRTILINSVFTFQKTKSKTVLKTQPPKYNDIRVIKKTSHPITILDICSLVRNSFFNDWGIDYILAYTLQPPVHNINIYAILLSE